MHTGLKLTAVALVLALAALLLASCGGGRSSVDTAPSLRGLPGLPQDGPASVVHHSSGVETLVIPGTTPYANDPGATIVPSGLRLAASGPAIGWAVYQVSGLDIERYVTSIDLTESSVSSDYWIALADYNLGMWTVVKSSSLTDETFPVSNPADYTSPGGNLYFALIVSDALIIHNQATIHIQNNAAPVLDPPANLAAVPGDTQVGLSWDAYTDTEASSINIYSSLAADMSGATLEGNVPSTDVAFSVNGLTNGQLYYFALTATDGALESVYSNIVSATPEAPVIDVLTLGGIWGRLGNDAAGTGHTTRNGPRDFTNVLSKDLSSDRLAGPCRTSPVLDSNGNVYALSRDGIFSSWTGDLATSRFSIDLAGRDARGGQLIPPQAPCVDAKDNIYFASVDADTGTLVFWGFDSSGGPIFDVEYPSTFSKDADNDIPFPSLNIAGGVLVSAANDYTHPIALNADGSEAWNNADYEQLLQFSAEPVYNAGTDAIEWPCTVPGIAVGMQPNWMSLNISDGSHFGDSKDIGRPVCYFGGVALPGSLHAYSNHTHHYLLDSLDGTRLDNVDITQSYYSGSPAYDAEYRLIYQPIHQDEGIVILGKLGIYEVTTDVPPQLNEIISQPLGGGLAVTGKPAIDGGHAVFVADEEGAVHRLLYDPQQPLGPGNPAILRTKLAAGDTFKYNSFALTDGAAYICSEQNKLYRIGNPFTD